MLQQFENSHWIAFLCSTADIYLIVHDELENQLSCTFNI